MFPKTLALLNQTFRVDVRQLRTHVLRGAVAAAVLLLLAMLYDGISAMSAPGLQFFEVLSWLSLILLSLSGGCYFPSVITEEKEQHTLGLLRMAGVGPATLLFGKSVGRLTVLLLLILITLPYWWLAVTLGGVTTRQIAAAAVALAAHLVLVSQIGTACSVLFATTGPAVVAACCIILGLMLGPTLAKQALSEISVGPGMTAAVRAIEASFAPARLDEILRSGYAGELFGTQAIANLLEAAGLFLASWLTFDWFNTYDHLDGGSERFWQRWRRQIPYFPGFGLDGMNRRHCRPRRATGNAIVWKDFQQFAGGRKWWRIRIVVFGICLVACCLMAVVWWLDHAGYGDGSYADRYWGWEIGAPLMAWMTFIASIEAIYLAGHVFSRELKDETWDSLRMLPISMRALCGWKILGCSKAFLPALGSFALGALLDWRDMADALDELNRWPMNMTSGGIYVVAATVFALFLVCFFSLKTNPWLGIVLAAAAFGFTEFAGFFCCFEVFNLGNWRIAFLVFGVNATVAVILTLILHGRIARILRGEDAAG